MPLLADDDVIVHRNPERPGDVDDRLGHVDIGARGRRIATWMIVHHTTAYLIALIVHEFSAVELQKGSVRVACS